MHSRILLALAVVLSVRQSYHSRYDGMGDSSIGHGARGDAPGAQDVSDGSGDPGSYVTTLTDEAADGVAEEVLEDIAEGRRPVPRTFGVLSNVAEILRDNKEVVDYEDDDAGERNWFGSSLSQKAGLVLAEKGSATHSLAETYTPVGKWKCDYDNVGGLMVYTGNCLRDVDYSYQNTADEFKAKALRDDLKAHYKTAADFVANVEGVANTPLQGWTSVSSQDPHHPNIIGAAVGGPNFAGSASALKAGLVLAEKGSLAEGEKNAHNKYKAYSTLDKKSSYQVWKQTAYEVGAKKVWWNPNHNAIVSRCATNRYWVGIEQGGNRAALCKVKRNIAVVLSGRIDEATYTRMMQGESTAFKGDEAETFKPKEKKKPDSVLAEY